MNLYQKIVEVRKAAGGFRKDAQGHGYKYVSGDQVLSRISDKMNELNLILAPSTNVGEHFIHTYKTKNGEKTDIAVKGEMHYTWINGDDPQERLEVPWAYYGQQSDISQAYGSGLTYAERYFLLKFLGLPTDEADPDGRATRATNTPPPADDTDFEPATDIDVTKVEDLMQQLKEKGKNVNALKKTAHDSAEKAGHKVKSAGYYQHVAGELAKGLG